MKNHSKIIKNHVFSQKGCFSKKKQRQAGMHHTDHRAGDPPKPPFPIESIEKPNKSENQPQNSRKKKPLFTSLKNV